MRALQVPVLDGIMLDEWTPEALTTCSSLWAEWDVNEVLLRLDKKGTRWTKRRGGYLIRTTEVPDIVRELCRDDTLTVLLEPKDPLCDLYSLAGVVDPALGAISVEVVGPGFDASDLMRGDVLVHETFELFVADMYDEKALIKIKDHHVISPEDYERSRGQRLAKIGARLINRDRPELLLRDDSQRLRLVRHAEEFLKQTKNDLLAEHRTEYASVPIDILNSFVRGISRTYKGLQMYDVNLSVACFSASVVDRGLVFWDYFLPPNEYTTVAVAS
jgi:hypothetical protein